MNIEQFWTIIDDARRDADGDTERQHTLLVERLAAMPDDDILDFQFHFRDVLKQVSTSRLWAAAYLIMGGCSDDCFDYFLGWLVAQGKPVVEAALRDPETLVEPASAEDERGGYPSLEQMWYTASFAYERKHSVRSDDFYEAFDRKYPVYPAREPMELDWSEDDDFEAMFPRLYARFGESPF